VSAREKSGKNIPIKAVTLSVRGDIIDDKWV